MNNVFATSIWLYLGDVLFVGFLLVGTGSLLAALAGRYHMQLNLTQHELFKFECFQVAWLAAGLVLFKAIILQGGPGFSKTVATGNHGSVQFSTIGEIFAGSVTTYGLYRWIAWTVRHLQQLREVR